jgi:hypothetical protein
MSEFRSGNKAKSHPYPATPRFSGASGAGPFAQNFANGPGADVFAAPAGTSIPWTALAVGAAGINVPITPKTSGNVIITTAVALRNIGVDDQDDVFVKVQIGGVDVDPPGNVQISMDPSQARVVTLVVRAVLPVGVLANVSVVVTGDTDISIDVGNSTIEIHEAPTATG